MNNQKISYIEQGAYVQFFMTPTFTSLDENTKFLKNTENIWENIVKTFAFSPNFEISNILIKID